MSSMKKYAIIVAGGSGSRMKSDVPKQFLELQGKPILMHTLDRFYEFDPSIQLVLCLPAAEIDFWKQLCQKYNYTRAHKIVEGGSTRYHSVENGLLSIQEEEVLVAIHDGVRPLLSEDLLSRSYQTAQEKGNSVPAVPLKDSVRRLKESSKNEHVDRASLVAIQTPQSFQLKAIKKAFQKGYQDHFTDDASVYEANGGEIFLIEGEYSNIKITTPEDMLLAEAYLKK